MRHIPEDELHAYLDQGLSRSQCVEIESHLAGCPSCQATRDGIAALRDRTTALLATPRSSAAAAPGLRHPAGAGRGSASSARRRHDAAGRLGREPRGGGRTRLDSELAHRSRPDRVARAAREPTAAPPSPLRGPRPPWPGGTGARRALRGPSRRPAAAVDRTPQATPVRLELAAGRPRLGRAIDSAREDSIRAAKLAVLDPAPVLELTPLEERGSDQGEQLEGMWRTMSWDGAQDETGRSVPHIDGLPVLRVQVQATDQSKRPLMVVAQQLSDGQVIQTIEGPAADVSQLLLPPLAALPPTASSG